MVTIVTITVIVTMVTIIVIIFTIIIIVCMEVNGTGMANSACPCVCTCWIDWRMAKCRLIPGKWGIRFACGLRCVGLRVPPFVLFSCQVLLQPNQQVHFKRNPATRHKWVIHIIQGLVKAQRCCATPELVRYHPCQPKAGAFSDRRSEALQVL